MTAAYSLTMPDRAALWQRLLHIMDIVLHLGAHRTGTSSFQSFLHDKADTILQSGTVVWTPQDTRKGLFDGLIPNPMNRAWRKDMQRRAEGRVKLHLADLKTEGHQTLFVSDENMLGSILDNLRACELYPAAGERMARYVRAFGGSIDEVVIVMRSLDTYWASSLSHIITRGHSVATKRRIDDLASARRSWRDVITDVACSLPGTRIRVMPFESHLADPDVVLRAALGDRVPEGVRADTNYWVNRSLKLRELRKILTDREQDPDQLPDEDGVWHPFTHSQTCALQEAYADDLFWLVQGADGLAELTEGAIPGSGILGADGRGHIHDQKGRLESTG